MNRWAMLLVGGLLAGPSWALAEDWPTYRHDIRRSGYSGEPWNAASVRPVWTFRSSQLPQPAWASPARWDSYANVRGLGAMRNYDPCFHVIVANGRLYFGSSADDSLYCLNAKTGEQQWTFTTDAAIRIAPTFSDGRLYFGSDDGHAYCVGADTGRLIWKSESIDGSQHILNNGRFVSLIPCRSGVLVDGKTAYFALGMLPWRESALFAVDAVTGKSTGPGHYVKRHFGLTMEGALLASETKVLAPAGRVAPYVFGRADGKHLGSLEGSGGSSVVLTDRGRVLCGPGNKTGWITETDVETRKQVAQIIGKTTAVITPKLRVLLSRFGLSAVDRKSKKIVWEASCSQRHELIVAGGTIFVGGDDAVAAYSLEDGRRLWEAPVNGKAFGLAVAGGLLYVSTDEGVIHCFGPGDGKTLPQVAKNKTTADSKPSLSRGGAGKRKGGSDKVDDEKGLLGRWLFHRNMAAVARRRGLPDSERRVADLSGQAHALIQGDIQIREVGGAEALQLDGEANSVLVTGDLAKARLPKNALTAEAWVRIDEPDSIGGVVGCFQDTKKQHQGWVLGCHHSRFVFALSATGGSKGFTYVRGETPIRPGYWYHVAATYDGHVQTLYVNGQLDGRSGAQSGEIQYPDKGFYEIGAFHDEDTDYHLYGMVHEIRVYDRALPVETVERQFDGKRDRFAVPIDLEIGPVARFVSPGTARVRWKTATPTPTRLVLNEGDRQRRIEDDKLKTDHEVLVTGLRRNRLLHYSIETTISNQVNNTLEFELDSHFNFTVAPIPDDVVAFAQDDQSSLFADAAKQILAHSRIKQGICLVIGNDTGRLAWELIRQSELRVIGVETDAAKVASARQAFLKAGLYGTRVAVHQVESLAKLRFVGHFANLIVSERLLTGGKPVGDAGEMFRVLRPNGGVVAIGQPAGRTPAIDPEKLKTWFAQSGVNSNIAVGANGVWLKAVRARLEGAGEWSHLYGRADNSAFGDEALAGASTTGEMHVQWIGRPGARAQPDRNGRKPSPLSTNGRLFVQGLHRIIAIDSFNGTILWALECPAWERFNMPRDCSNWCADDDYVYIAAKNKCWKINAATGDIAAYHPLVPAVKSDWSYEWGYVGLLEDRLLGTAQRTGASFTSFWGDAGAGWYDARSGPATFKVCSDKLFALEKQTGGVAWSYENGVIINSTITAADRRVFFVESRNAKVKQSQSRRVGMPELWKDQFLVAVDLATGKKVWESPIDTADGTVAFYLAYAQDTLVLDASTNKKFEVSAFSAADGKFGWKQTFGWFEGKGDHGKAISRPAIVGDRVFVRPKILDLKTGEMMPMEMPKGKCGTYAATTNAMVFRTTKITLWNTSSGSASSWDRMRPGCWLSTIPAGGMLLSPEGGGGCSCGSWMEMSVGFMPGEAR